MRWKSLVRILIAQPLCALRGSGAAGAKSSKSASAIEGVANVCAALSASRASEIKGGRGDASWLKRV
jgi:hypothetical protein